MALVLDTGVLYAVLDEAEPDHPVCRDLLGGTNEQPVIPAAVLVELEYWVRKFSSPQDWLAFCEDVHAGSYAIYPLDPSLLLHSARLQARYAKAPIGLVDATVFSTCEVLGETRVATLDRRHFSLLKTEDGRTLEIVP